MQVFVDEMTCIGCRNCTNVCPNSFGMEEEFGRARVMQQRVDTEDALQEAIDTWSVSLFTPLLYVSLFTPNMMSVMY